MGYVLTAVFRFLPRRYRSGIWFSVILFILLAAILVTVLAGWPQGGAEREKGLPFMRLATPEAGGGVVAGQFAAMDASGGSQGVGGGSEAPKSYYDLLLELEMYEYIPQEACTAIRNGEPGTDSGRLQKHLPIL